MDLCGHATLAVAHALASDGLAKGAVRFDTRSGVLGAHVQDDGRVRLDFPAASLSSVSTPAGLSEALGVAVGACYDTGQLHYLIVEVADEAAVRAVRPDLVVLAALPHWGISVTAAADPGGDHDFMSRFFAPRFGTDEDPVTGSAHTALAPLWAQRLGRHELVGLQASPRSGLVHTVAAGDRVRLTGRAVTVLDGTLHA